MRRSRTAVGAAAAAALAAALVAAPGVAGATPAHPEEPRSSSLAGTGPDRGLGYCVPRPAGPIVYRQLVAAGRWCVGLTQDREVVQLGEAPYPSAGWDAGLGDVVQVSAGSAHGLALDERGQVASFGTWDHYVCDDDCADGEPATVPPEVREATIIQVAAGGQHDLALTDDGRVLAWGPATSDPAFQVPASLDGRRVARIDAGPNTSAAITAGGHLVVWGDFDGRPLPPRLRDPDTRVTAVDVSDSWGMALTRDDTLLAFGSNALGRLEVPSPVRRGDVIAFAAGEVEGLAGTADGRIHRWSTVAGRPPVALPGRLKDLSAGNDSSVALIRRIVATRLPSLGRRHVADVGETLTSSRPTWSVAPSSITYRWTRSGRLIPGARGLSYRTTRADVGHGVRMVATASRAGYPATAVPSNERRVY